MGWRHDAGTAQTRTSRGICPRRKDTLDGVKRSAFGGTIMGTQASDSIANSYGQTHEIANLWIAGPGLFPNEGASNPTYTIFAVSLRRAEQLAGSCGTAG